MADPAIQTHQLTKHFKHPFFVWQIRARALTDLNITVERGEIFGLLGPNGSGKSTTIKLLLGMLWPTSGEIAIFNRRPHDVYVKQRLSYLPEETHLYRFLNAEETLDFYGQLFQLPRRERRRRVEALLDLTGLRHTRNRPLGEFSKGMQRRIGLAQALINDPELVILDEPTSGLDPLGTREVKNIVLELKAKKKTVLLSSHLLDDVEDVCDRVAILYGGKMRASGAVDDLLRDQKQTAITGEMPPELLTEISALLKKFQSPATIAPAKQRLESLFMQIVHDAEKAQVDTSGARNQAKEIDFLTAVPILEQLTAATNNPRAPENSSEKITAETPESSRPAAVKIDLTTLTALTSTEKSLPAAASATKKNASTAPMDSGVKEIHREVNVDLLNDLTKQR